MAASLGDIAVGNAIPGGLSSVEGVNPEFARRILRMYQDMPPNIQAKFNILSGFRSPARQAQVNPAVKDSQHSHGYAVDTTKDPEVVAWVNATGGKYGVNYPLTGMRHEENHLEMVVPGGGRMRGLGGYARAPAGFKSGLPGAGAAVSTGDMPEAPDMNKVVPPPVPPTPGPPVTHESLARDQEAADARVAYYKAVADQQNNPFTDGSLSNLFAPQTVQQPQPQGILQPLVSGPIPLSTPLSRRL